MSALDTAREWLVRQRATAHDDMLDEGDCRTCGCPAGEGHEDTDPCGIIAGLVRERQEQEEALDQWARTHETLGLASQVRQQQIADLADSLIEVIALYDGARDLLGPDVRHKLERAEAALRKAGVK